MLIEPEVDLIVTLNRLLPSGDILFFYRWAMGGKNLTINQVAALLTDVKEHGDWERALVKHIPKRKLLQPEDLQSSPAAPYHKQQQYRAPLNDRYPVRRRREQQQFRSVLESLLSQ